MHFRISPFFYLGRFCFSKSFYLNNRALLHAYFFISCARGVILPITHNVSCVRLSRDKQFPPKNLQKKRFIDFLLVFVLLNVILNKISPTIPPPKSPPSKIFEIQTFTLLKDEKCLN
jgi:hypothetical protein